MEQRYAQYIDSEWKIVYCEALRQKIQEVATTRCYGCEIDHPSQRQHSCLMHNEEDNLFYYFTDALESLDEETVFKEFEDRLQQSPVPPEFIHIYKEKFNCKDWLETIWKSEDNQCELFDTIHRLINLDRVF